MAERNAFRLPGLPIVVLAIALVAAAVWWLAGADLSAGYRTTWVSVLILVEALLLFGLTVVNQNQSRVLQLFGRYAGTLPEPGLWWVNPFTAPRRRISLRVRSLESPVLKVNDYDGNPIEIATVVIWRVDRPASAVFAVEEYDKYVHAQSETAIRKLTTSYPYDAHDGMPSLRGAIDVNDELTAEIQARVDRAGVIVLESRISHLAYAQEIAHAMLQRQQAGAIVAARTRIVDGAVGMVEMALERLSERDIVQLDEERKASMVSNLLVVLCGDRSAQPVVNTGTIYQ